MLKQICQRDNKLDFIRGIAILLVMLTHASEPITSLPICAQSILTSLGRIGVPLFFFISGALMIPKANQLSISRFYRRYGLRIVQFVVLLSVVSIVTNTQHYYYVGISFPTNLKAAILNNNCIISPNMGSSLHLWYMYAIIFCYLVTPFLSRLLFSLSNSAISLLILILSASMLPVCFSSFAWEYNAYLAYYVCGHLFHNLLDIPTSNRVAIYSLAALLILITVTSIFESHCGKLFTMELHWYPSSLYVLVTSYLAWIVLKTCAPSKKIAIISSLSSSAFGIYLWHIAILHFEIRCVELTMNPFALVICRFFLALLPTWLIVHYLRKIPVVNYLIK